MELIQWFFILALGGAVAYLWRERRENQIPSWLRDLQQDDWITRAELDQYHLQIIQMSQAQRDLMNARFDELSKQPGCWARDTEALEELPIPVVVSSPGPDQIEQVIPELLSVEVPVTADPGEVLAEQPALAPESGTLGFDAPSRAISLFREGKTIEQIAQELRIGRQETQLLIRMAQHKPSSFAGV